MKTPLSKPYITQEIKDAVLRVIDGGNFILGKESEAFDSLKPGEDMVGLEQAFQVAQDEYRPGDSKKK